jgi:hypothetical protein
LTNVRPLRWFAALLASAGAAACTSGATDDPALDAWMRIEGAQFVRGGPPVSKDGPRAQSITLETNTIWAGDPNKRMGGALDASATAAAIDLAGDAGYWIVPAGPPDISTPTLPSFDATASFSTTLAARTYTLEVRAVDTAGNFGPPLTQALTGLAGSPSDVVTGVLVVTLTWDTESDIDLHVVDPLGNEIFHGAPSSDNAFAPGASSSASPGVLDVDSNADCVIDGRREEDVTWSGPPPSGHYLVRVDASSLCGEPFAHYRVTATLRGKSFGAATGTLLDQDTWGAHDRGAGLLALTFDVP